MIQQRGEAEIQTEFRKNGYKICKARTGKATYTYGKGVLIRDQDALMFDGKTGEITIRVFPDETKTKAVEK